MLPSIRNALRDKVLRSQRHPLFSGVKEMFIFPPQSLMLFIIKESISVFLFGQMALFLKEFLGDNLDVGTTNHKDMVRGIEKDMLFPLFRYKRRFNLLKHVAQNKILLKETK